MTLVSERILAIQNTRQFLYDLLDPKKTPRVPRAVRQLARHCLKHYPTDMYLIDIFSEYHSKGLFCKTKIKR